MPVRAKRIKRKLPEQPIDPFHQEQRREISGILLIFLALIGLWTLRGSRDDGGLIATYLRLACVYVAGDTLSFLPLLYLLGLGIYLVIWRRKPRFLGSWLGSTIFCLVILSGFDLIQTEGIWSGPAASRIGGGLAGGIIAALEIGRAHV